MTGEKEREKEREIERESELQRVTAFSASKAFVFGGGRYWMAHDGGE